MRRVGVRAAAITALVVVGLGGWTPYGVAAPAALAEPVDLGGQDLPDGSRTDAGSPIELTAGLWADELGTGGAGTHYFTYRRTMEESTVHVGVIGRAGDPDSDGIGVAVTADADATSCADETESSDYYTPRAVFGAAAVVGQSDAEDHQSPCARDDTLAITVSRGSSSSTEDLPIAIKVVEEAPVRLDAEGGDLPEPDDEVRYRVPAGGSADDRDGGTSFEDAPLLDPVADGVTVRTEIPEGDERLYRVPVDWGQQVVAGAQIPVLENTEISGPTVDLRIVEPSRNTEATYAEGESSSGSYGSEVTQLSVGILPLRYLNRFAGTPPTLPGDYWVAVAVQPAPADRDPIEVPVELAVAVAGEPGENAPSYQPSVLDPGGDTGPDGYSPDTPYLVGDGQFAAVASGNPFSSDDDDSWWGARRIAGLGLGAVSLACCAVGAVWLIRRRTAR